MRRLTRVGLAALALLGAIGAALLAFSILGLIGQISTPIGPIQQRLSPTDLASSAVAGATLMLAVFTAYLAIATRESVAATRREAAIAEQALAAAQEQARIGAEQVKATNRHAEIAQESLEASWRPVLVDVLPPLSPAEADFSNVGVSPRQGGGLTVKARLRNIGSGPAIINRAGLSAGSAGVEASRIMSAVVAPRDMMALEFYLLPENTEAHPVIAALLAEAPVAVTVFYGDQGGHHRWRTRAELHSVDKFTWRIRSLELSEENAEPFAKSGSMFDTSHV